MHPSFHAGDRGGARFALGLALALVVSFGASGLAWAQDEEEIDQGQVYAIHDRAYRMNHEFSLSFGFLPLDAFYKMFAVGGHYVVHFDDLWAWEAVHGTFSKYMAIDTGLKGELSERWDTSATNPEEGKIDFVIDTNLMVKPLYIKAVLFDDWVIHGETYFLLGVGAEKFLTAWFPALDAGAGMRIFLGRTISLRLEVREYIHFADNGVGGTLSFGLAFCYNAFAEEVMPAEPVGVIEGRGGRP